MGANGNLLNQEHGIKTLTYKEQAYDVIKDAILYRRLTVGEIYSQDELCSELGISRTPVREALLELQKEGYITFRRGRGITIVPMTRKEAVDIVEMRFHIEFLGSRLAAQRITEHGLAGMKTSYDEMDQGLNTHDSRTLYQMDRKFHRAMFEGSENGWLLNTVEKLRDHFLRVETQTGFDGLEKRTQIVNEHKAVYEAISRHDPDEAEAAMRNHLDCTYNRTIRDTLCHVE